MIWLGTYIVHKLKAIRLLQQIRCLCLRYSWRWYVLHRCNLLQRTCWLSNLPRNPKGLRSIDLLLEVAVVRPFHSPCSITMTTLDISFAVRRMSLGHWLKGYPSGSKELLLPLGDNLSVYWFGSLGSVSKLLDQVNAYRRLLGRACWTRLACPE